MIGASANSISFLYFEVNKLPLIKLNASLYVPFGRIVPEVVLYILCVSHRAFTRTLMSALQYIASYQQW